jgi:hypothetical protein
MLEGLRKAGWEGYCTTLVVHGTLA